MAAEVDQVATQELTSQEHAAQGQADQSGAVPPASHVAEVAAPTKGLEGGEGTTSTEQKPTSVNEPAQQGAAATSTEPAKPDNPAAETAPVEDLANGDKTENRPQEAPTMTGALPEETAPAASSPSPPNLPDAPEVNAPGSADDGVEHAVAAPPNAVAAETNGKTATVESIESKAAPVPEPSAEVAASEVKVTDASRLGDKRKAEEPASSANGESADKKAKTDESVAAGATNGANGQKRPGRPRKNKDAAPQVGRTARKTRSQGPVEG